MLTVGCTGSSELRSTCAFFGATWPAAGPISKEQLSSGPSNVLALHLDNAGLMTKNWRAEAPVPEMTGFCRRSATPPAFVTRTVVGALAATKFSGPETV